MTEMVMVVLKAPSLLAGMREHLHPREMLSILNRLVSFKVLAKFQ